MDFSGARDDESSGTRAIVLVAAGAPRHPALEALISSRGWTVTSLEDPAAAFAELCLLERTRAARQAWGLPAADRLVFVLARPGDIHTERLLDAAQWYLPHVSLWVHDGQDFAPLTEDVDQPDAEAVETTASPRRGPGPDSSSSSQLTPEEIDMLFGGEPAR